MLITIPLLLVGACGVGSGESTTDRPTTTSTDEARRCSASDLSEPVPQAGLPGPVAETRRRIAAAALACDFAALAKIESPQVSFGSGRNTAAYWRLEEAAGREPMRALIELLDSPYATLGDRYVWPAAFARPSWDDVSPEERDDLRSLYDDEDFARFEQFGSYVGWRIGISGDGTWSFFTAGD